MLNPPSMVPSSSVALARLTRGLSTSPQATRARNSAFTRGGVVHPGGNPVGEQVEDGLLLARGGLLHQSHEALGLGGVQGQGGDPEGGPFGDVLAVFGKHVHSLGKTWN